MPELEGWTDQPLPVDAPQQLHDSITPPTAFG